MAKIAGSGSINQRYGFAEPDPDPDPAIVVIENSQKALHLQR
jgi:hypothetical protein